MRTLGVLLLAAGSVALWVLGRNYGLCHQWWIDPQQAACRQASTYHVFGIWLMILGGLSLVGGQIARLWVAWWWGRPFPPAAAEVLAEIKALTGLTLPTGVLWACQWQNGTSYDSSVLYQRDDFTR